jgi:hypothetical protein
MVSFNSADTERRDRNMEEKRELIQVWMEYLASHLSSEGQGRVR